MAEENNSSADGSGGEPLTLQQMEEALKQIGVPQTQLKRYVKGVIKLRQLEKQYGKSLQTLFKEYEKRFRESVKLEYSINELLEKRRRIEEDLRVYMEQQKLTLETVNRVNNIIRAIEKYGINIDDLETLAKVAAKISETGTDFKQVFEAFAKLDETENKLRNTQALVEENSRRLEEIEHEIQRKTAKLREISEIEPEFENISETMAKLRAEVASLEKREDELRQKIGGLTKEYEDLLGFKTDAASLLKLIEEKRTELNRLDEELARVRETLQTLEEEVASARSLLLLLQNPELVKREDLEILSRQLANISSIKAGEMPELKALEPSLLENVRKRVVELVMPVIRSELVPHWVFEKLEKEFKEVVAKKAQLEEENERLRNELNQLKGTKTQTTTQSSPQLPRKFQLLKQKTELSSDSGIKIKLKCVYCQNSSLMILPTKQELEEAESTNDILVTTCGSCGKDIPIEPRFLIDRFFKG
ncbi:MAG: hypothetical protein QXD24_06095 [Candidatus Caldarchaeum sp.]